MLLKDIASILALQVVLSVHLLPLSGFLRPLAISLALPQLDLVVSVKLSTSSLAILVQLASAYLT